MGGRNGDGHGVRPCWRGHHDCGLRGFGLAFSVKCDTIQKFFLNGAPRVFDSDGCKESRSYKFVQIFMVLFFGFLFVVSVISLAGSLVFHFLVS